jgi:hypothetical protein
MRIEITKPGLFNALGAEIPVGTELTVKDEPKGWAGRYRVVGKTEGKTAVTAPTKEPAKTGYEAKHRGGGSYSVVDKDGNEVIEKLTKEQADTFNGASEDDKAKFVEANKKAAA